jgi:hypothetical protein
MSADSVLITRACLKNAFRQMCVTVCGRFVPNEGGAGGGQRHKGQCLTSTEYGANITQSGTY